jgi:arylsulfatase A-like enzyme
MTLRAALPLPFALVVALAGGCDRAPPPAPGHAPGPVARFLAREMHLATRLDAPHGALEPRVVVARPSEATWQTTGATLEFGEDGRLRAKCPEACTLDAELPGTRGVEYTLNGLGVGPVEKFEMNSGVVEKDDAAHIGRRGNVFDVVHRTQKATGNLRVHLEAKGDFTLTQLEIREARLLNPMQLVATSAAAQTGYFRLSAAHDVELIEPSILAAGESQYTWPLEPGGPTRLVVRTAPVPRHGLESAPVTMRVEVRVGGQWAPRFEVQRGGAADTAGWQRAQVDISGGDALRLSTQPVSPGGEAAAGSVAWGSPALVPATRPANRPDVVLITLDALRADKVGAFGNTQGLTPTLDALAAQGVRFSEARCQRGETWVSLSSLAHGAWPEDIDVGLRGAVRSRGHDTLAEVFAAAGYRTGRIGNVKVPPGQLGEFETEYETQDDDSALTALDTYLAEDDPRPMFLWLHLQVTHYPYLVPPPYWEPARDGPLMDREAFMAMLAAGQAAPDWPALRDKNLRLYDAAIRALDAELARVTAPLLRADRPNGPAVLAVTADHGSAQGEGGMWFMHALPYRSVLRVPMLLVGPGRVPAGGHVDRLVRVMDLAPTLLDYAGLLGPVEDHFTARTLRGLVEGRPEAARTNVVQLVGKDLVVAETDTHKLIANPKSLSIVFPESGDLSVRPPRASLYAWREDPTESKDLALENPLLVGELWRLVVDARATLERNVTPETRRLLMQAGYAAPDSH